MVDNSELLLQRAPQQWIAFAIFVDTHTVYISYLHYILNKTMLPSYKKTHVPGKARAKTCHRLLSHEYYGVLSHS